MRLRQLVLACGLTSLVLSPYASALGLGEVKLKSTLNQPLEAEVKLLDTRDLTAEQILVSLASPADFERNGVDRLFFYTEFQFQVDLQAADGPKVVITSRSPVREPYLNFLVEARWTAGRLLREYTLLMDLPTFDDGASTQAVQAATTRATPSSQPRTTTPRTTSGSGGSSGARQSSLSGDEYEVRNNDTLWDIALRARPDGSVSVHQSMMALYRANPEAFINGNINRLRRGQVLRIPDASEMKSVGKTEAVSQFAQATGDSDTGAQLNASRRTSSNRTESTEASGRVKLAAPSAGTSAGQGSGANDGAGKALESELAVTLEELDKSKAENTELSSRVKDLEAQIETMERLVEVSNEKLRALQVAAGQAGEASAAQMPETAPAAADPVVAQAASVASSEAAASSAAAIAPPQPTPPKKAIVPPKKPEPTLVDTAIENAPWIGLGVLGLAGAGYFAYRRRKQAEDQQADEQEDVFAMDDSIGESESASEENADHFEGIEESSLFDEDNETTAVAETGDVVGEADIYIAYGKLDQAEEMLLNALQKDPNSADIRMKLLEVYAQQQNAPAFDNHYAALLPIAGAALIARASELREGISGAGAFDPVAAEMNELPSETESFSFDDLDLSSDELPVTESESSNFDFDLDLNLDDDADNLSSEANLTSDANFASSAEDASEELANEFELDFEGDLTSAEADDLSELSLALDDLETEALPEDIESTTASLDEEFSFDLDDDLSLNELSAEEPASSADEVDTSLDVAADDFNLDMNVDDVDLAALDHEMESLDVDFDDDLLANADESGLAPVESVENVSLDLEDGFALDDFDLPNTAGVQDEISTANLNLTDSLDQPASMSFDADSELADFNLDEDLNELSSPAEDELASGFELQNDDAFSFDAVSDSSDNDVDLASLEADLGELNNVSETWEADDFSVTNDVVDLESQDEIPSYVEPVYEGPATFTADLTPAESESAVQDEDLFAEALSDFGSDSDEINLNDFSSDEAALADLTDDEMDAELDFLADADEAATKLDLARAYIDMGDSEGAKDILSEVLGEGNDEQRKEATELLGRIG